MKKTLITVVTMAAALGFLGFSLPASAVTMNPAASDTQMKKENVKTTKKTATTHHKSTHHAKNHKHHSTQSNKPETMKKK